MGCQQSRLLPAELQQQLVGLQAREPDTSAEDLLKQLLAENRALREELQEQRRLSSTPPSEAPSELTRDLAQLEEQEQEQKLLDDEQLPSPPLGTLPECTSQQAAAGSSSGSTSWTAPAPVVAVASRLLRLSPFEAVEAPAEAVHRSTPTSGGQRLTPTSGGQGGRGVVVRLSSSASQGSLQGTISPSGHSNPSGTFTGSHAAEHFQAFAPRPTLGGARPTFLVLPAALQQQQQQPRGSILRQQVQRAPVPAPCMPCNRHRLQAATLDQQQGGGGQPLAEAIPDVRMAGVVRVLTHSTPFDSNPNTPVGTPTDGARKTLFMRPPPVQQQQQQQPQPSLQQHRLPTLLGSNNITPCAGRKESTGCVVVTTAEGGHIEEEEEMASDTRDSSGFTAAFNLFKLGANFPSLDSSKTAGAASSSSRGHDGGTPASRPGSWRGCAATGAATAEPTHSQQGGKALLACLGLRLPGAFPLSGPATEAERAEQVNGLLACSGFTRVK